MELDWPIHLVASNPRFWTDYFWLTEVNNPDLDYAELVNYEVPVTLQILAELEKYNIAHSTIDKLLYCRLNYPIGDEYSLILKFSPHLDAFDLNFLSTGSSDQLCQQIAWDDQAHWHPHVLRWEELDLICKCVALREPTLPHPGLPLLMLCRFAPITDSDDADWVLSLLWEAWRSLNLFSNQEIEKFISRVDRRGYEFEWQWNSQYGWLIQQAPGYEYSVLLYTLRFAESPEFPFTQFERMMEVARHITAASK